MPVTTDDLRRDRREPPLATVASASDETPTELRKLLSPQEVSELCGLNVEVIRRAIRDGELRASKLRGKLRVRHEDFDAWIDQNAVLAGEWV
jgi:excisionase family DNA binding protein